MDFASLIRPHHDPHSGEHASTLALLPTAIVVMVDATALGIIVPLLPFYSQRLGATPFLIGALMSAYAVCQLIAGPAVGTLSDRYGRRNVLIMSQLGTFAGLVLLALANSLTLVFLARIIDGLTSGNISVAHAYAAEHSAPSARKQAARHDQRRDRNRLAAWTRAVGLPGALRPVRAGLGRRRAVFRQHPGDGRIVAAGSSGVRDTLYAADSGAAHQPDHAGHALCVAACWRCCSSSSLPTRCSCPRSVCSCRSAFTGTAIRSEARELGYIFAYAGFLNIIVQGLLITRVKSVRIGPGHGGCCVRLHRHGMSGTGICRTISGCW